jgi:hypothetical protein
MEIKLINKWAIEYISKDLYKVTETVEYMIWNQFLISIEPNFEFDWASVPKIAKIIWIDDDDYLYCSLLHDFLYREKAKIYIISDWNCVGHLDFISLYEDNIYWHWKRKFADICYRDSLKEWDWIKKKDRLSNINILLSHYVLRLFWFINFRKKWVIE